MELKEKHKINFTNYIYKLEINDTFKRLICDENFINENPEFYLYYPILFSETFNISKQHLSKLSIAGYLYYQSTLFTDSLIDKNDKSKIALISICLVCNKNIIFYFSSRQFIIIMKKIKEKKSTIWIKSILKN